MIGLKRGTVELSPYRPAWRRCYEEEVEQLRSLTDGRLADFEHIGSTAIEGMAAKPIVDLLAVVPGIEDATDLVPVLEANGYEHRPDSGRGRVFLAKGPRASRTHYLSLAERDSEFYTEKIAFRDYLRSHPEIASGYERLKRALADEHPDDRDTYTERKGAFIDGVLERAMDDR